jgi:hypothetical protein
MNKLVGIFSFICLGWFAGFANIGWAQAENDSKNLEVDRAEHEWFTVTSEDQLYNSPMIGNGRIITTIGPAGYHNGFCPDEEKVNRRSV